MLEVIQRYVEILDKYFGNVILKFNFKLPVTLPDCKCSHLKVCELDIIFNYEKAHFIWNEYVVGGELVETSKSEVLRAVINQDDIQIVSPYLITLCLRLLCS